MSQYHNKLRNLLKKNGIETPENKLIVDVLEAKFPDHGKLAEWLHREARKDRIRFPLSRQLQRVKEWVDEEKACLLRAEQAERQEGVGRDGGWRAEAENAKQRAKEISNNIEHPERLAETDVLVGNQPITVETLDSITTILKKKKQRGEESSAMKFTIEELLEEARALLFEKKARDAGEVLYRFDDGWSIRRICTGEEMRLEGEMLGHCAGQYAERVDQGESHNYSLRDDKGFAHLTLEIKHTRPSDVDMMVLFEAIDYIGMDYSCPYCEWASHENNPVIDGRCHVCFFNIEETETWHNTPQGEGRRNALREKFEKRHEKIHKALLADIHPNRNNFDHQTCPSCNSRNELYRREPVEVPENDPRIGCHWCGATFWETGDPYAPGHPMLVGEDTRVRVPAFCPGDWRIALQRQLGQFQTHDFRDGEAYQIQGKQNVSPHAKYHPYIQEWMRSIPYKERPLASWSAYYTRTPVLHVADLELGGAKGEDDFGFKWENRPYNWASILFSLHGEPKRWAKDNTEHVKRFQEEDSEWANTLTYQPELGEQLFKFVKKIKQLDQITATFDEWKNSAVPPRGDYYPNPLRDIPCIECSHTAYLIHSMDKTKVTCNYCGDHKSSKKYDKDIEARVEEVTVEPEYPPYQKAVIGHIGALMEADRKVKFKLDSYTNITVYKGKKKPPKKTTKAQRDKWMNKKQVLWGNQQIQFQQEDLQMLQNRMHDHMRNQGIIPQPVAGGGIAWGAEGNHNFWPNDNGE